MKIVGLGKRQIKCAVSSASSRMCKDKKLFTMMKTLEKPLEMVLRDRHVVKAQQEGTEPLTMK